MSNEEEEYLAEAIQYAAFFGLADLKVKDCRNFCEHAGLRNEISKRSSKRRLDKRVRETIEGRTVQAKAGKGHLPTQRV